MVAYGPIAPRIATFYAKCRCSGTHRQFTQMYYESLICVDRLWAPCPDRTVDREDFRRAVLLQARLSGCFAKVSPLHSLRFVDSLPHSCTPSVRRFLAANG